MSALPLERQDAPGPGAIELHEACRLRFKKLSPYVHCVAPPVFLASADIEQACAMPVELNVRRLGDENFASAHISLPLRGAQGGNGKVESRGLLAAEQLWLAGGGV